MAETWQVEAQRLNGRVDTLEATIEARAKDEDGKWSDNRETHRDLYTKVDRPSWAVTVVLSCLSSGVVGLAVFALTRK